MGVKRWSDNRLHSAPVDRIPLGETIPAMSMFYVYKLCNRLTVLNKLVNLDWLNLSLIAFKLKAKSTFLIN